MTTAFCQMRHIQMQMLTVILIMIFYGMSIFCQVTRIASTGTMATVSQLLASSKMAFLKRHLFTGCYRAIERDYNLDSRLVRDTIRVTSLIKCEEACTDSRLFGCRTFAFSSSLSSSFNCYLSDRSSIDLDTGLDLVRDFDSAVYEKIPCNFQDDGYRTGTTAAFVFGKAK